MKKVDYEQFNKELKELMDKHGVAELRITQQISIIPQEDAPVEAPVEAQVDAPAEETKE